RFRTMLVLMAVLLAALAVVPAALGQAGQNRTVLSVVTIRNQAKEAIAYQVQWSGGSWQGHTVAPGEFKHHWHGGEAIKAQIRFSAGQKEEVRSLTGRDFAAAGKGTPTKLMDGHLFSFRGKGNATDVSLIEEFRLDKTRMPEERKVLESAKERRSFPRLLTNYEVLGPANRQKKFNCISWSIGITERWVWPGGKVADFDRLYASHGYQRATNLDFSLQPGVHKLALYGHPRGGTIACTHAARQEADGTWTSKLGPLALIRHLTLEDLNGPSYGEPVAV